MCCEGFEKVGAEIRPLGPKKKMRVLYVAMAQKRAKRDISETALPIKISKFRKHFSIQTTPQNLGKITSETTFGHSKVVFQPLLRIKRAFSQNPPMARF